MKPEYELMKYIRSSKDYRNSVAEIVEETSALTSKSEKNSCVIKQFISDSELSISSDKNYTLRCSVKSHQPHDLSQKDIVGLIKGYNSETGVASRKQTENNKMMNPFFTVWSKNSRSLNHFNHFVLEVIQELQKKVINL